MYSVSSVHVDFCDGMTRHRKQIADQSIRNFQRTFVPRIYVSKVPKVLSCNRSLLAETHRSLQDTGRLCIVTLGIAAGVCNE